MVTRARSVAGTVNTQAQSGWSYDVSTAIQRKAVDSRRSGSTDACACVAGAVARAVDDMAQASTVRAGTIGD